MWTVFGNLAAILQTRNTTVRAIETAPGSGKRRCIETSTTRTPTNIPGRYVEDTPYPSMTMTPPSSRPSSASSDDDAREAPSRRKIAKPVSPRTSLERMTKQSYQKPTVEDYTSPPTATTKSIMAPVLLPSLPTERPSYKQTLGGRRGNISHANPTETISATSPSKNKNTKIPGAFPEDEQHGGLHETREQHVSKQKTSTASHGSCTHKTSARDTTAQPVPKIITPLRARGMSIMEQLHEMYPNDPMYMKMSPESRARYLKSRMEQRKAQEIVDRQRWEATYNRQSIKQRSNRIAKAGEASKDAQVDRLVSRVHKVSIDSPDARLYQGLRKLKAEREEKERLAKLKEKEEQERREQERKESAEQFAREQEEAEAAAQAAAEAADKAATRLIHPLDKEWTTKLAEAMKTKNPDAVLATSPEGNPLSRRDFGTLLGNNNNAESASSWLNDEIVNAFLGQIVLAKHATTGYVKSATSVPNYVAYNSAWFTTYKSKGISGIKTWQRRKGIAGEKLLRAEKIFFPINTGAHWMLMVISPSVRTIEYLDSLNSDLTDSNRRRFIKIAREFLAQELGTAYKAEEWAESEAVSSLQGNFNDCGAFSCFNALASATGGEFGKVLAEDMQTGRKVIGAVLMGFKGAFEV